MIAVICFCGFILTVFTAPVDKDAQAKILGFENTNDGKGNYRFSFQTSNGIFREESGAVINEGQPNQYIEVQGFVSFTDPDGNTQSFTYVANDNGYVIVPQDMESEFFSAEPPSLVASLLG